MFRNTARGFGRLAMTVLRCLTLSRLEFSSISACLSTVQRRAEPADSVRAVNPFRHERAHDFHFFIRDAEKARDLFGGGPLCPDDRWRFHCQYNFSLAQFPVSATALGGQQQFRRRSLQW